MLHLYLTVFYKVMSSTERVSRDQALTPIARFREHHIRFAGAGFKQTKMRCSLLSLTTDLLENSAREVVDAGWKISAQGEKRNWQLLPRQLSDLSSEKARIIYNSMK